MLNIICLFEAMCTAPLQEENCYSCDGYTKRGIGFVTESSLMHGYVAVIWFTVSQSHPQFTKEAEHATPISIRSAIQSVSHDHMHISTNDYFQPNLCQHSIKSTSYLKAFLIINLLLCHASQVDKQTNR